MGKKPDHRQYGLKMNPHRDQLFQKVRERTGLDTSVVITRMFEAYVAGKITVPGLVPFKKK